jgi:hypothetical protein
MLLNIHGQINDKEEPLESECSAIFEHIRCDRLLDAGYSILSENCYHLDLEFARKHSANLTYIPYADFFNKDVVQKLVNQQKEDTLE